MKIYEYIPGVRRERPAPLSRSTAPLRLCWLKFAQLCSTLLLIGLSWLTGANLGSS